MKKESSWNDVRTLVRKGLDLRNQGRSLEKEENIGLITDQSQKDEIKRLS